MKRFHLFSCALTGAQARGGILIALVLLLCTSIASATTWVVKPDGTGDFATIQDAVGSPSVVDGDTIALTDGILTGSGNRDIDYSGKAITIRSKGGSPDLSIIDCQHAGRGFYFHSGEDSNSVLEGVTITNGSALDSGGVSLPESLGTDGMKW